MLIFEDRKFIQTQFESEEELERVVQNNAEFFFGPSSIYFSKTCISTSDGFKTIPDGIAIDIAAKRWYIVEAELIKHNVWLHIAPQVSKQIVASTNLTSRQLLIDLVIDNVKNNRLLLDKFRDEEIDDIDISRLLEEIFKSDPVIGMPIDTINNDLRDWAATLKYNVKLWIVRKHVEFGQPKNVMYEFPEEFKPIFDTSEDSEEDEEGMTRYDVTITDLLQKGFLRPGEKLLMSYKSRQSGERRNYEATIRNDGIIDILGKVFDNPSYAALYCIQDAGSERNTVNGWISWKNSQGLLLSELREQYLERKIKTQ